MRIRKVSRTWFSNAINIAKSRRGGTGCLGARVLEYRVDVIILLKVLEHSTFLVYRLSSLLYISTGLQRNKLQTLLHSKTNQSANIFYNIVFMLSMRELLVHSNKNKLTSHEGCIEWLTATSYWQSRVEMQSSGTTDHVACLWSEGQSVFVRSQYFWTTRPSKKLSEKYLGPYEIIAQPSPQSFTLRLPDTMRAAHPVFHVSMLEPATPNTFQQRSEPPPAPVIIDGEPEYEISKIVDSKIDRRRACKLLYKVIWLGYEDTDNDSEWLPATELEHAKELLNNFHLKYPSKLGPLQP